MAARGENDAPVGASTSSRSRAPRRALLRCGELGDADAAPALLAAPSTSCARGSETGSRELFGVSGSRPSGLNVLQVTAGGRRPRAPASWSQNNRGSRSGRGLERADTATSGRWGSARPSSKGAASAGACAEGPPTWCPSASSTCGFSRPEAGAFQGGPPSFFGRDQTSVAFSSPVLS